MMSTGAPDLAVAASEIAAPADLTITSAQAAEAAIPCPSFDQTKLVRVQGALEAVINCHSLECGSDTPDFILAQYLVECLAAFDRAVTRREEWYGGSINYGPDLQPKEV